MTGTRGVVTIGVAILLAATAIAAMTITAVDAEGVLGPGPVTVTLDVNHSRFSPDVIHVRVGTTVTFVVVNDDPINHELIVGDDDVHTRHENGSEADHPPVPGEVSVGPGESARTTYVFDGPGTVLFACHLPGHFDYGMHGSVRVHT